MTQSTQSTLLHPNSESYLYSLPWGFPNTLGDKTSQKTSSSLPLFENIQTLESIDPCDIIKEEKEKKSSSKEDHLSSSKPDEPLAQPRLLPMYDGLIDELTLTTFEPILVNHETRGLESSPRQN